MILRSIDFSSTPTMWTHAGPKTETPVESNHLYTTLLTCKTMIGCKIQDSNFKGVVAFKIAIDLSKGRIYQFDCSLLLCCIIMFCWYQKLLKGPASPNCG